MIKERSSFLFPEKIEKLTKQTETQNRSSSEDETTISLETFWSNKLLDLDENNWM